MLFNSISFTVFLPAVFVLYWVLPRKMVRYQNILLLIASYFFYGCWDWRFLGLLSFSTLLDFYSGLRIHNSKSEIARKRGLIASVTINLGFLAYFKYFGFFVDSFAELLSLNGLQAYSGTLNIILPIGISFYTFHGLSYVFDIYNRKVIPTTNFVDYALFVSFFPLLVAGPIERATHLLPQIERPRTFEFSKAVDGLRQMLWGFFKKVVIADGCAAYATPIFSDPGNYSGSTLALGAVFFAFQIYGDFSGYSDIALGTARLFGFELLKNFNFPYFSRDIAEFWRRWHISLSSWFKDYLYYPLGGSRGGKLLTIRNTLIIFAVSGFWHGANWTFIAWGLYHGLLFLPLVLLDRNRQNIGTAAEGRLLPSFKEAFQMGLTFIMVTIGWILFRAENITKAVEYLQGIADNSLFSMPMHSGHHTLMVFIALMFGIEWLERTSNHPFETVRFGYPVIRWSMYLFLLVLCLANYKQDQEFIYFQF
ncbi:MAG: membrane-bound O-acyltransferase family protein [Dyadobacter sp. 50-39]|uniref:MBOAT family O-acyltransferase n=1 Tax=Dyadobacter sp. 50-39 TaxID=1895756 RepID=UPI0009649E00|nr:MBOAT family O-acyltransferase [Dyadobacter sp. 50-39]OJV17193.1 MAG: membrane-bound O-acyltransferase family protein [Dyadobacter sp. 50-39]